MIIVDDRTLQLARDTANALLATQEAAQGHDIDPGGRVWLDAGVEVGFAALLQAIGDRIELENASPDTIARSATMRRRWWRRRC